MISMLRTISAISCFLISGPLAAASTDCMSTRQTRDYLRGNTLIGKSLSSGKKWKAKFRKASPVTFNYSSGGRQTYRWFVNDGVILLTGANGKKYKKRICRRNGKYYWTDAATGKVKSRILRSTLGDRTVWARSAPLDRSNRNTHKAARPAPARQVNAITCNSIRSCRILIETKKYRGKRLAAIHYRLASVYKKARGYGRSYVIGAYKEAIRNDPNFTAAYAGRGRAYLNCCSLREGAYSGYNKAIADFTKVAQLARGTKNEAWAYDNRGMARKLKRQYKMAIQDFTKAIDLNYRNANYYLNRGEALVEENRFNEAMTDYRKAVEMSNKYGIPRFFSSHESMRRHVEQRIKRAKLKNSKLAQIRKAHQATQQACIIKYHSSKKLFKQFERQASVVEWPDSSALSTNPYVYKGKVIGILTVFHKMLSEHEASFGENPFGLGTEAHVSGVPSTKFQKPEVFLLAGKVTGKNGSMVALQYIDAISCGNSMECENVLFWQRMDELRKRLRKQPKQKRGLSFNRLVLGISVQDERCAMSIGR